MLALRDRGEDLPGGGNLALLAAAGQPELPAVDWDRMHPQVDPPRPAARPIQALVGSEDFTLLELDAGHIGLAAGRTAHKVTFPRLVDWLARHSEEPA